MVYGTHQHRIYYQKTHTHTHTSNKAYTQNTRTHPKREKEAKSTILQTASRQRRGEVKVLDEIATLFTMGILSSSTSFPGLEPHRRVHTPLLWSGRLMNCGREGDRRWEREWRRDPFQTGRLALQPWKAVTWSTHHKQELYEVYEPHTKYHLPKIVLFTLCQLNVHLLIIINETLDLFKGLINDSERIFYI